MNQEELNELQQYIDHLRGSAGPGEEYEVFSCPECEKTAIHKKIFDQDTGETKESRCMNCGKFVDADAPGMPDPSEENTKTGE